MSNWPDAVSNICIIPGPSSSEDVYKDLLAQAETLQRLSKVNQIAKGILRPSAKEFVPSQPKQQTLKGTPTVFQGKHNYSSNFKPSWYPTMQADLKMLSCTTSLEYVNS